MKKTITKTISKTIYAMLLCFLASASIVLQAQVSVYNTILLGAKESPPNASPGIGAARVTIDATANTMRLECAFSGLTGNITAAHIHAATASANTGTSGVATQTPTFSGFPTGVTAGNYDRTFDMTLTSSYNASFVTANGGTAASAFTALKNAMNAEKSYLNLHSSTFGGGEIRGFLSPCTPTGSDTTASVCNSFKWNGVTYYNSGDKTFTTTNAAGCDSVRVLHLTILSVPNTFNKTDAGCYGSTTGSLTIQETGGTGPFTYRLGTSGPISGTSGTFNNLKAGTYRAYVKDATGCIGVAAPIVIAQGAKVTAAASGTNLSCYGSGDGTIAISNPTGVAPFQYKLGRLGTFASLTAPQTITGLRAGNYAVYIKDANGCEGPATIVSVTQPGKISATFSKVDETCPSALDGSITATGNGGTPPYEYKLNTTGTYSTSNMFTRLAGGTYKVYAKDANGCIGVSAVITLLVTTDPCPPPLPRSHSIAKANSNSKSFNITLSPNPSSNQFILVAHSGNTKQPVSVRVVNTNGRSVYETKGQTEQIFSFGNTLPNGLYMVEVRQGEQVKTVKAMKIR